MTSNQLLAAQTDVAENLLYHLFKCISSDYKKKYAKEIWSQFEHTIRACSYTSKFSNFIEAFCKKLPNEYYQSALAVAAVSEMTVKYEERDLLRWMRESTTLMVTMVRVKNDELKSTYLDKNKYDEPLQQKGQANNPSTDNLFEEKA